MILTALRHGSPGRQVTVLAVHVVGSRTRVVAQPDTEVLDLLWFLLVYLKAVHMTLHRRKASQALLGDGGGGHNRHETEEPRTARPRSDDGMSIPTSSESVHRQFAYPTDLVTTELL